MATHSQVAHAWANQTGKQRRGFNMFYEGPVLYSHGHHWELARLETAPNGQDVALGNAESPGRSLSTNKHYREARRAARHLKWFDVVSLVPNTNYDHYITEANEAIGKAKRARKYQQIHLDNAERFLATANDYAVTYCLGREPVTLESLDNAISDILERARRNKAEVEARERARQREARKGNKPLVLAWLSGEEGYCPHTGRPLCRVKGDKVETSWGASVPLDVAITVFRLAAKVRRSGNAWQPQGLRSLKVGDFTLNSIGRTGNIVVGCHNIPFRFAKLAADRAGISLAA
jgi:hypothetical protein